MDTPDRSSDMNDDIQRLVESLRSPGLESELRGESFAVDAIASTMTAKDFSMNNRLPRKARVASFIAAGIIGFGGVAAAGPAVMDQIDGTPDEPAPLVETDGSVPEETEESSTPTTIESIDDDIDDDEQHDADEDERPDADENDADENDVDENDTDEDEAEEEADEEIDDPVVVDDPDTAFDETECVEGSHGKTVSSVARSDGRTSQDVVDAAQSSCGKPADHDQPDDAADDAPDAGADVVDDEADGGTPEPEQEPDDGNGHGNGGENRNGNSGNGNGNGNGNRQQQLRQRQRRREPQQQLRWRERQRQRRRQRQRARGQVARRLRRCDPGGARRRQLVHGCRSAR